MKAGVASMAIITAHSTCADRRYRDYVRIEAGYAGHGGLARLHDLLYPSPARPLDPQCAARLRLRILAGQVIVFPLKHELWMPRFQFGGDGLEVIDGIAQAIFELKCFLDPAEIALWFCTSNAYLGGMCPAEKVAADPETVRMAARIDCTAERLGGLSLSAEPKLSRRPV